MRGSAVLLFLAAASCQDVGKMPEDGNFSQYPGFEEIREARGSALPDARQRALLERFKPIFMLPEGHAGLIDFYRDYIAHGELHIGRGPIGEATLLSDRVTRRLLNAHKGDPRALFIHRPPGPDHRDRATVYGRFEEADIVFDGGIVERFSFLSYYAVFRHSGIAAGVSGFNARLLALIGDLDDWHQLDHYTAATVVLDGDGVPIALHMQQHNGGRTYVIGESTELRDGVTPTIDVALRSNELYPHRGGRALHRAVRFPDVKAMRYLLGYGRAPFFSGDDVVDGRIEADYRLEFLPDDDAFYLWEGYLGALRRLPGRDGPPGAEYNTLPEFKAWDRLLFLNYWREGDEGDRMRFEEAVGRHGEDRIVPAAPGFLKAQKGVFYDKVKEVERRRRGGQAALSPAPRQ